MIQTASDLLQEFINAEKEILDAQQIEHPTTIGSMYEGLTGEVLNNSIFEGLNLRVVKNSFIKGCKKEFDVMLVIGDGERLPHTDRYIYNPKHVIVVIQVKKNLYSDGIKDSYENLLPITDLYITADMEPFMYNLFRDSVRAICQKDLSAFKLNDCNKYEEAIYFSLKKEVSLPVRIVWGYNGFSNEYKFRESYNKYLEENISTDIHNIKRGFGPHNFPNLVMCGKYSMVKINGMPWGGKMLEGGFWPLYVTTSFNPMNILLEVVWTRLSYMFELPLQVFGEDLQVEPLKRFLACRITELGGRKGWEYRYFPIDEENLVPYSEASEWRPIEIDEKQFAVISEIGSTGSVKINKNPDLESFVKTSGYNSLEDFVNQFVLTGLVYKEGDQLKLLTDNCQCVFTSDEKIWAAENKSGRLTHWALKYNNTLKPKR